MAPNFGKCAGCQSMIQNKEYMICSTCNLKYDLGCANISAKRFCNYYAPDLDRKRSWNCPECCSKIKKTDNSDTPVRSCVHPDTEQIFHDKSPSDNVTLRPKSRQVPTSLPESSIDNATYVKEKDLRSILKTEIAEVLRDTINTLVSEQLNNITSQFSELCESMSFFNKQYEEMKSNLESKTAIIDTLLNDNKQLKVTVSDLSIRLNSMEQNMRSDNIEIHGVEENRSENLNTTFQQLVKVVDAKIEPNDIIHITRVAKMTKDNIRPRTIVAKLRTPKHRDIVLAAVSNFNKKNSDDKLCSKHLGYGGPRKPVFISEHLSPANKALHAATRLKAREVKYKYTWVRNGRIFVRKDESSESIVTVCRKKNNN